MAYCLYGNDSCYAFEILPNQFRNYDTKFKIGGTILTCLNYCTDESVVKI